MGQKVNPFGIRLGIINNWSSRWYAEKDYAVYLLQDIKVKELIEKQLYEAGISKVLVERPAKSARITIFCSRPGVVIGQKGKGVEQLRQQISKIVDLPLNVIHVKIEEIKKPELDARLSAQSIAAQLEQRVMFRRAMKRVVSSAMRSGALGVKVCVSGRLGGAEIARTEWYREGRVPLHTFRADIDYGFHEALTTFGIIGIKVWIFKGEKLGKGTKRPNKDNRESA